jgi:hypothetical protein
MRNMKKLVILLLMVALGNTMFTSCEFAGKNPPPDLPPYESMAIDFSDFNTQKSADDAMTSVNYSHAAANVAVYNFLLGVTLVVPVAAFKTALYQKATYMGDATWEWTFTVDGFAKAYTARLVGKIEGDQALWFMYVKRSGVDAFDEFLWYSGTSNLDGSGGQWILNQSHIYQEPALQIDWVRNGDQMGEVKYTIVRELNDNRVANEFCGSYLEAGKTDGELNAYYNIYQIEKDNHIDIEWSTTNFNGHVADPFKFGDTAWHCWDGTGADVDCE